MRVAAPIASLLALALLLGAGGCGVRSDAKKAAAAPIARPAATPAGALGCQPWPDGQPPADPGLRRSADQSVAGTETFTGVPAQVTVGLACVVHPPAQRVEAVYCGAAELGAAPRPCLVGEECAVGSVMVTEITSFQESDGVATCGVFENWSPTRARAIAIWAKLH